MIILRNMGVRSESCMLSEWVKGPPPKPGREGVTECNMRANKFGAWLETMSWLEAETVLNAASVVVIPLGGAAKEHGPHLPLNNDARIAIWLAGEIAHRLPVVIAPLINASFYPAFVSYPGSISLRPETARDLLIDICRSLAAFGVGKFYVLNTGVSTECFERSGEQVFLVLRQWH
jgi:hypothetical protein